MESFINVDKNMIVNTTIGDVDVRWHDVRNGTFSLHGFYEPFPVISSLFPVQADRSVNV